MQIRSIRRRRCVNSSDEINLLDLSFNRPQPEIIHDKKLKRLKRHSFKHLNLNLYRLDELQAIYEREIKYYIQHAVIVGSSR